MTQHAKQANRDSLYNPIIERGENDIVHTRDGRMLVDLVSGFGTTLLGHARPEIVEALQGQASRIWSTGRIDTDTLLEAREIAGEFSPASHKLAGFYSTGMEAAEFAMRIASQSTGRGGFAGFARNMHGKSMATAYLCWPNPCTDFPAMRHLPFLPQSSEAEILEHLGDLLSRRKTAALFIEPFQGSGGGYSASAEFFIKACSLAQETGTLVVVDEVLSGIYRTGERFFHPQKNIQPDIVLTGKTMGNGFPVSAVYCREQIDLTPKMLPGSTYSENALAAAVVHATLKLMKSLDLKAMTTHIESVIRNAFDGLESEGFHLRGKGAFHVIEVPPGKDMAEIRTKILEQGILTSCLGSFIRLLPAATIQEKNLLNACQAIRAAIST